MGVDRVFVRDLTLRGILGVNEWERENPQEIRINIDMFLDCRTAGEKDDLQTVVNYRMVTQKVIRHVEVSRRYTIEALAEDIARICLDCPCVRRAVVSVEKPGAIRFARTVGVEIDRSAHSDG